jgi:hypothetical protein
MSTAQFSKDNLDIILRETAANLEAMGISEFKIQPAGSEKILKKKKCKDENISCGFTCISGKKTCRISMTMEQQRIAKELRAKARAANKPAQPEPEPPQPEYTRNPETAKHLAALDKAIADGKELDRLVDVAYDRYIEMSAAQQRTDYVEFKKYQDALNERDKYTKKQINPIARKLLNSIKKPITPETQAKIDKVKFYGVKTQSKAELRYRQLTEYAELTGDIPDTLDIIFEKSKARAGASEPNRAIQVAPKDGVVVMFHEIGHHQEFSTPGLKEAAAAWRDEKADLSKGLQSLRMLTGANYRADEMAYVDTYVSPYVGKVYKDKSTEVVSMGIQHFSSGELLAELRRKDPSHVDFIMEKVLKV